MSSRGGLAALALCLAAVATAAPAAAVTLQAPTRCRGRCGSTPSA